MLLQVIRKQKVKPLRQYQPQESNAVEFTVYCGASHDKPKRRIRLEPKAHTRIKYSMSPPWARFVFLPIPIIDNPNKLPTSKNLKGANQS